MFLKISGHIWAHHFVGGKDVVSERRKWFISPPFHRALTSFTRQKPPKRTTKHTYLQMGAWSSSPHHFQNRMSPLFWTKEKRRRHNNGRKRGDVWLLTCPKPRPTFLTFTSSFLTRQVTSKCRILSAEDADELNRFE